MMELQNLSLSIKYVQQRTSMVPCPGLYCGRIVFSGGNLSSCSACPRGFKPDKNDICQPCNDLISPFDWMYLAFMALLPLVLHVAVIDMIYRKWRKRAYSLLLISACTEAAFAAFITILMFKKSNTFEISSCGVERLTDWYTLFFNPRPDYVNSIRCTQEIVYPLYSIIFMYYFFSLLFMLIFRGLLAKFTWSNMARNSMLAALYQYPLLLTIHACLAGLIYYVFPVLTIIISVISSIIQFAVTPDQTVVGLCKKLFTNPHSLVIVFLHWLFLAFGVIALSHFQSLKTYAMFLACIPVPTLVYIGTIHFTDPKKFYDHFEI